MSRYQKLNLLCVGALSLFLTGCVSSINANNTNLPISVIKSSEERVSQPQDSQLKSDFVLGAKDAAGKQTATTTIPTTVPSVSNKAPLPSAVSGKPPTQSLMPRLDCVKKKVGFDGAISYTAYFGYNNPATSVVNIPVGSKNHIVGANNDPRYTDPQDRGQPTQFQPGNSRGYPHSPFKLTFDQASVVWVLNNSSVQVNKNTQPACSDIAPVPPPVKWQSSLGPNLSISGSAPALAPNGNLVISGGRGQLLAVNAQTGQVIWDMDLGTALDSSPLVDENNVIYVGGRSGKLYAINPNGTLKWVFTPSAPNAFVRGGAAMSADGTLFVGGTAHLYALNRDSGNVNWQFETRAPIFSAPVVHQDQVYFQAQDQTLYAVNINTGEYLWEFQTGKEIFGVSPALDQDGNVYFGSQEAVFYAADRLGQERWSFVMDSGLGANPVISENRTVYIPSSLGTLYAYTSDGQFLWKVAFSGGIESSPALDRNGNIYLATLTGEIVGINADGEILWRYQAGAPIQASLLLSSTGVLYALDKENKTHALEVESGIAPLVWPLGRGNLYNTGRIQE